MYRISLVVVAILIVSVSAEQKYGFHPLDSLYGNVKSIKESNSRAKKKRTGEIVPRTLDPAFSERRFRNDGKIIFDTIHELYGQGSTRYFYNERGQLTKKKRIHPGTGICDELRYEYDARGNCPEESNYNGYGKLDERTTCSYDPQNRIVERIKYDRKGKIEEQQINFRYDHFGNEISKTIIDSDGDSEKDSASFSYDDQGRIVREISFEDGKTDGCHYYHYTPEGRLKSAKKTGEDTTILDDLDSFTYNNNGELVEYLDYGSDNSIQRRKVDFKFDQHGNWIYLLMMDDDRDLYVYKREIDYY